MPREHLFRGALAWDASAGTTGGGYEAYGRHWTFSQSGKPALRGSAAGAYRGDESRPNPEDLLVASVAACHMLSFLALAARAGHDVTAYTDAPEATMTFWDGKMRIVEVRLSPVVTCATLSEDALATLHHEAHDQCFIANSVSFPVSVT